MMSLYDMRRLLSLRQGSNQTWIDHLGQIVSEPHLHEFLGLCSSDEYALAHHKITATAFGFSSYSFSCATYCA